MKILLDYFQKVSDGLKLLGEDIGRMVANIDDDISKEGEKAYKVDDGKMPMKSMQPMTRIRKDKKALVKAQNKPEITFIEDKLKDILE